jgi:hypothetical protein
MRGVFFAALLPGTFSRRLFHFRRPALGTGTVAPCVGFASPISVRYDKLVSLLHQNILNLLNLGKQVD